LQKSAAFLYNSNKQTEKEYRKIISITIATNKNNLPRNKFNTTCVKPLQGKLQTTEERNQRRLQMEISPIVMDW
jgi:hypothetical protein